MGFAFAETLSGGIHAVDRPAAAQPVTLALEVRSRGWVEAALGAPLAVTGRMSVGAPSSPLAAFVPHDVSVEGTLRLLVPSGLHYDLRLGAELAPRDRWVLRGERRFVRGDLLTSVTTFVGTLSFRGATLGEARLRFDARDDVPRLLRSVRREPSPKSRDTR